MIKTNSLVKLYPLSKIEEIYRKIPDQPSPLGNSFGTSIENQLFIVRRVSNNIATCEYAYPTTSNRTGYSFESININIEYLELLVEDIYIKERFDNFNINNKEYKFDESFVIYPLNERIPHEILNDNDEEELMKCFSYEDLKVNLVRALYALFAAEERIIPQIKKEDASKNSGNNSKKPTVKPKPGLVRSNSEKNVQWISELSNHVEKQVGGKPGLPTSATTEKLFNKYFYPTTKVDGSTSDVYMSGGFVVEDPLLYIDNEGGAEITDMSDKPERLV